MKLFPWIAALLALAVGFGIGRATRLPGSAEPAAAGSADPDLSELASFEGALDDSDWLRRTWRMSAFLQQLDAESLPGALAAVEARLPWLVTDELRLFMFAWTRFDAPGALARALTWPRLYRRSGAGAAIYAWAYRDPAAALEALAQVESEELRSFMEKRLIAGWAHGPDKEGASAYLTSLHQGPLRFEYVGMLAWELSKQGPDAVIAWAEGVPDLTPRYKKAVFLKAAGTLAALDAPRAAQWLEGHLDQEYGLESLRVVARSWAVGEPEAALAWAMALPDAEPRRRGVRVAFDTWLDRWPDDAMAWLFERTPAPELDSAVRVVVARHADEEPAVALSWAARLDDPALREEVQIEVGRAWAGRSPAEARDWLETSDLSESARAAIRSGADGAAPPRRARAARQRRGAARVTTDAGAGSATATP